MRNSAPAPNGFPNALLLSYAHFNHRLKVGMCFSTSSSAYICCFDISRKLPLQTSTDCSSFFFTVSFADPFRSYRRTLGFFQSLPYCQIFFKGSGIQRRKYGVAATGTDRAASSDTSTVISSAQCIAYLKVDFIKVSFCD